MPYQDDGGDSYSPGTTFTYDPGSGQVTIAPPTLPAGVTQQQIDASNAANPQAAGSNGTLFTYGGSTPMPDQTAGSGGGSGAPSGIDYSAMLGMYGLPPDVMAKVNSIFATTSDANQAAQLALAYIRGTDWYAKTYPGIVAGIQNGTISNEADYRSYLNNANILSQQYLGRQIGSDELSGYLSQGYSIDRIGRMLQGGAIAQTNGADWRYATGAFDSQGALTADEQNALGQEQAGIDTALGQRVQKRLSQAQQRLQGVFQGSLATPGLSAANGRLSASTLGGSQSPDVSA